jgi:hypothetical protein
MTPTERSDEVGQHVEEWAGFVGTAVDRTDDRRDE